MQVKYATVKNGSRSLRRVIATARGDRNRQTRRSNRTPDEIEAGIALKHQRKREREHDRAIREATRWRFRVRLEEHERPKIRSRNPRNLFYRYGDRIRGSVGTSDARGRDGLRSIHYEFTARGFASTKGRRWRTGEAERAARYGSRAEGLEGGEAGWWSNIAEDRSELTGFWRVLEAVERNDRKNANVYISEVISLDCTLTSRQRRKVVRRICKLFEKRGLPYMVALHLPDASGDQRNYHAHVIYSLRPARRIRAYDWEFGASKERDINTPDGILARRKAVVAAMNATLRAAGSDRRYTHLSNRARGMAAPAPKQGQAATWILRRLVANERKLATIAKLRHAAARISACLAVAAQLDKVRRTATDWLRNDLAWIDTMRASLDTAPVAVAAPERLAGVVERLAEVREAANQRLASSTTVARERLEAAAVRPGAFDKPVAALEARMAELKMRPTTPEPVSFAPPVVGTDQGRDVEREHPGTSSPAPARAPEGSISAPSAAPMAPALESVPIVERSRERRRLWLHLAKQRFEAASKKAVRLDARRLTAKERLEASLVTIRDKTRLFDRQLVLAEALRDRALQREQPAPPAHARRRPGNPITRGLRATVASRTPETDLVGPDPGKPRRDPDPGRISRAKETLRDSVAERAPAVVKRLRRMAWQRLSVTRAVVTRNADGGYGIDDSGLLDEEWQALHHPAWRNQTQTILAAHYIRQNTPGRDLQGDADIDLVQRAWLADLRGRGGRG